MESKYIRLTEEYRLSKLQGDIDKAEQIFAAARRLVRSGTVSDEELEAAKYL